jgi:retron-type reverse transcriptase
LKRIGNLFETVFSKENIYQAYLDARKGKRKKRGCFDFEASLSANLSYIHESIHNGTYKPAPYFKFIVFEPKERVIYAPSFLDIVVQHAIYRIVYPIFNRSFIDTSFACRKGMGTHKASDYALKCIRACDSDLYYLQCDIRKFFYSIDRAILECLILKKIKDRRLVNIMMIFAEMDTDKGIPIGNLLSQTYALIYLNPLDHFIKRVLKVKRYVRYVDDFLMIGIFLDEARAMKAEIEKFIQYELNLYFSKTTIQKIRKGINFVGYRTWKSKRFVRKYSLYKFRKSLKQDKNATSISILGHAKWTNSIKYMRSQIKEIGNDVINQRTARIFRIWADSGWHGNRA